jgi:transcriptional regulator with XRE-family HTH domain
MARPSAKEKQQISLAVIELRRRLGETQQDFANRLGIALPTVARYETSSPPRGAVLDRIAQLARENHFVDIAEDLEDARVQELLDLADRLQKSDLARLRKINTRSISGLTTVLSNSGGRRTEGIKSKQLSTTSLQHAEGERIKTLLKRIWDECGVAAEEHPVKAILKIKQQVRALARLLLPNGDKEFR